MDADVVIVGAGPVGLMLAGELGLAGVRPLILERQPRLRGALRGALSRWFGLPRPVQNRPGALERGS
jgi:2-polyprenyl-6-methoxyphenol hydroxylase-like FAD-dependent oxidoreductase